MNPLPIEDIYPMLLGFVRAVGLLMVMPVFSGAPIPMQVRVAVAAILGVVSSSYIDHAAAALPPQWWGLVLAGAHELVAGLLMGWAARFLFYALEFAGQVISTEIGLIISTSMDPITHGTSSPGTGILSWLGTMLFLLTGAYRDCLWAFVQSFVAFPPGAAFAPDLGELVVEQSSHIFSLAIQFAAPIMAVNFLVNFVFALLGRVAPSLEPYSASVPVRLVAGVSMLGISLSLATQLIQGSFGAMPEMMLRFLR